MLSMPAKVDLPKIIQKITSNRKIAIGVIILLTLLAYANIFQNDFALDDYSFIVRWPLIKDIKNFPLFFTSQNQPWGEEGIYSPVRTLIFFIHYHLWGLNPVGYHVGSMALHLIVTALVYFITLLIAKNNTVAFLSSLFFGLHPVHTEAITFITASVDMSGVLFFFISFLFYIKSSQMQQTANRRDYIFSLVFAALAIFTYELTISLPILFLFYDFCFRHDRQKKDSFLKGAFRVAPYLLIAVIYALIKFIVLHSVARGGYIYGSFYLTMLVMIKAVAQYILILFWPVYLTVNHVISKGVYSFPIEDFNRQAVLSQSFLDAQVLISLAVIILTLFWSVRIFKRQPLVSFCIGWFFIGLLPAANIIPSGIFFGERYLYLLSFGFCLLLGYLLTMLYERKDFLFHLDPKFVSLVVIIVLVIFYAARTVLRNRDWRSDLTINQARTALCPDSAFMHAALADAYTADGQPLKALEVFKETIAIRPDDPDIYFSMTDAYMQLDEKDRAIASLNKAIELKPDFAEAFFNLAVIYGLSGQEQQAEDFLQKSLVLYRAQNKTDEAEKAQEAFDRYFHQPVQEALPDQEPFYPE